MQTVLERGSIDAYASWCFQSKCSNISAEGLHFSAFHYFLPWVQLSVLDVSMAAELAIETFETRTVLVCLQNRTRGLLVGGPWPARYLTLGAHAQRGLQ